MSTTMKASNGHHGRLRWLVALTLLLAPAVLLVGGGSGAASPATTTATPALPPANPDSPGITFATAKFDLSGPFLFPDKNRYVLFLSSGPGTKKAVPVMTGSGPNQFHRAVDALPKLPRWALPATQGGGVWEPEVHKFGNTYVMYYSPAITNSTTVQHCVGIATSKSVTGPYRPQPHPFICQQDLGGSIDAEVFTDPNGPNGPKQPYYLIWKSDNNNSKSDGIPTVWAQPLSNNGLHLIGNPTEIMQGGGVIEAPQMAQAPNGQIWMFYSNGIYTAPDYHVNYVSCVGPLGPCNPASAQTILASNAQGPGPGEESVFIGRGGSTWLLYNPWHVAWLQKLYRPAEAVQVGWGAQGPYLADPVSFPQP